MPALILLLLFGMSGGTMLALASDEIVMDENAVWGPIALMELYPKPMGIAK